MLRRLVPYQFPGERENKVLGSASALWSRRAPKNVVWHKSRGFVAGFTQIHLKPAFPKAFDSKEHNQKLQLIHMQLVNKNYIPTTDSTPVASPQLFSYLFVSLNVYLQGFCPH